MLCLVSIIVISIRLWFMVTGEVVEGQIVGYVSGGRVPPYGIKGHNYRIRLTYQDEMYYVTSIDSVVTSVWAIPKKNLGLYVDVYFNPKSPKRVAIKRFHKLEWAAFIMFALGAMVIRLSI